MKRRKVAILFSALVLPVLIFGFLKFFGKNQFDLPVLHLDASEWPVDCPQPDQFPFKIKNDSIVVVPSNGYAILLLAEPETEAKKRIPVEIDTTKIPVINLPEMTNPCIFGAGPGSAAILIDSKGSIRGIFASLNRDETDRLIMESKILSKDY